VINIVFKSLTITGFRSIKQSLNFQLEREPGLYFVSGQNLDEPQLGSNGSGKSTIWDAISWVNFGKTVDGTKGEDVINWDSDTCEVIERLTKDGVEAVITRTQNPNSIRLQVGEGPWETVEQSVLDAFLNLDYDRFINCLIVGQFNATFLDYLPSEKLKMFSTIMPVEFWEQCSTTASKCSDTFAANRQILTERLRGLSNKQDDQKARREALNANQGDWEKTRQTKILDLTKKADSLHIQVTKLEAVQKEPALRIDLLNKELNSTISEIERLQSKVEPLLKERNEYIKLKTESETTYSISKQELDGWKILKDKCPTCLQSIDLNIAKNEKTALTKKLVFLTKKIKNSGQVLSDLTEQLTLNTNLIAEVKAKHITLTETIKELNKVLTNIGNDRTLKLQEIRQIRETIETESIETNPYSKLIEQLDSEILITDAEKLQASKELEETNKNYNGSEYWIKGFKELRMWVISDALTALEIESNNALSKLGLIDWKIKFQMERETQKGGINKGFHVMVHSKKFTKDKYLPLKIWSGGEARRLKLGGVIGFSSLIQNYTGVNFNISVWDEPSSYLSKEGIDDLIEFLSEQAEEQQKVIYFVDQRNLEASNFKEVIKMIKTEEGTTYANTN
jgi:DNA repair exonuclease SbcCD ATPase subunit